MNCSTWEIADWPWAYSACWHVRSGQRMKALRFSDCLVPTTARMITFFWDVNWGLHLDSLAFYCYNRGASGIAGRGQIISQILVWGWSLKGGVPGGCWFLCTCCSGETPSGAVFLLTVTRQKHPAPLGNGLGAYQSPQCKCFPRHCSIQLSRRAETRKKPGSFAYVNRCSPF